MGSCGVSRRSGRPLLLLVEDDDRTRSALARVLKGEFVVRTAACFAQAAQMLVEEPVELVLSDYELPGASGIHVLDFARWWRPQAGRILISARPPQLLPELVDAVFTKPWPACLSLQLCAFVGIQRL